MRRCQRDDLAISISPYVRTHAGQVELRTVSFRVTPAIVGISSSSFQHQVVFSASCMLDMIRTQMDSLLSAVQRSDLHVFPRFQAITRDRAVLGTPCSGRLLSLTCLAVRTYYSRVKGNQDLSINKERLDKPPIMLSDTYASIRHLTSYIQPILRVQTAHSDAIPIVNLVITRLSLSFCCLLPGLVLFGGFGLLWLFACVLRSHYDIYREHRGFGIKLNGATSSR